MGGRAKPGFAVHHEQDDQTSSAGHGRIISNGAGGLTRKSRPERLASPDRLEGSLKMWRGASDMAA